MDSVRLEGVDTAEIKTRNPTEKKIGIYTRDWVRHKLLGKYVNVEFKGRGKFGRPLVIITKKKNGVSINKQLLNEGLAYVYDGKTKKQKFEDWFDWPRAIQVHNQYPC